MGVHGRGRGIRLSLLNVWSFRERDFLMLRADMAGGDLGMASGLDVSLDSVAVCVIGDVGEVLWQGKVPGDPRDSHMTTNGLLCGVRKF